MNRAGLKGAGWRARGAGEGRAGGSLAETRHAPVITSVNTPPPPSARIPEGGQEGIPGELAAMGRIRSAVRQRGPGAVVWLALYRGVVSKWRARPLPSPPPSRCDSTRREIASSPSNHDRGRRARQARPLPGTRRARGAGAARSPPACSPLNVQVRRGVRSRIAVLSPSSASKTSSTSSAAAPSRWG